MRYARTGDGLRIAFAQAGEGRPLVRVPNPPFAHCQVEWRQSAGFYDRLARGRKIVTFDPRGTGLSDRDAADYSLGARLMDIEAVVESAGLDRFALQGVWSSGALVIAYAARHPERVTHLVLDDTFADARAASRTPLSRAFAQLANDWEALTEHIAFSFSGSGGDAGRRYAEFMRGCTTQEAALAMCRAFNEVDVTELLPRIESPTLIAQHAGLRGGAERAREMAALIPDARLVVLDGKEIDDLDHLLAAIGEFLGDEPAPAAGAPSASPFRTILYTDIVAHTEMMHRLGDARGREVLREHERITRELLREHGGTEVKTMGDGFLASFASATSAVECAIGLQRTFAARDQTAAEPIAVRVGINAGEPIAEDDDLFGASVTLTERIMSQGRGGEILVSDVVRGLVAGKGFAFADRGAVALKGFDEPVRVFEARWREG